MTRVVLPAREAPGADAPPRGTGAPIYANEPQVGYYATRLVKGGPMVPARIWLQDGARDPDTGELVSDQVLCCTINGKDADPFERWTWLAGREITKAEYDQMMRVSEWAAGSNASEGQPTTPMNPRTRPPTF